MRNGNKGFDGSQRFAGHLLSGPAGGPGRLCPAGGADCGGLKQRRKPDDYCAEHPQGIQRGYGSGSAGQSGGGNAGFG